MMPSDAVAVAECFLDMSDEGGELYQTLGECANTNNCMDFAMCDACSAELMACQSN